MTWKTLSDLDLAGKRVLTRVDINVPVDGGKVADTTRIDRIVPTVEAILGEGGQAVLLAHFGRPKGKADPAFSLRVVLPALEAALGRKVAFIDHDGIAVPTLPDASTAPVCLVENIRFYAGETKNDPALADGFTALGDVFVNDAFSAAHRAHMSTEGLARRLPCAAGLLMQAELEALSASLSAPKRPVTAVVGGAKVSTKLDLLGNLVARVDTLIVGGGMANTFLHAMGKPVGKSLCEPDLADTAREILSRADAAGCRILLPADVVVAREFKAGAANQVVAADACPDDAMILDAGPAAVAAIVAAFEGSATLIWNGPLGAFEIAPFDTATNAAAAAAARLTSEGRLLSVAGGGDTVAALKVSGADDAFSYISTAGGAFLEWMEGKTLPGVAALSAN